MYQYNKPKLFGKEFKLQDLAFFILKRWYILLIVVLFSTVASHFFFKVTNTPMYSSSAKMYVINKASIDITTSDLNTSLYLSNDFAEIILDTPILNRVCEKLDNAYTPEQLKSYTTLEVPEDTRVLIVTARTPNALESKRVVDSICQVAQEELVEIMGLDRIKIIKAGNIPEKPNGPSIRSKTLIASLLSAVIAVTLLCFLYVSQDTIIYPEDIKEHLNLSILSTVPHCYNKHTKK